MVSDMRDWCDQQKYPRNKCLTCKDRGWFIKSDILIGQVAEVCYCDAGKRFVDQQKIEKKISWDEIWMNLAKNVSTRSTCKTPNRQVGCVIVSEDNTKVLAIGYNGSAKGDNNSCDYVENEIIHVGQSRCSCVHAEMNALVKLDTSNPCKKKMYLTLSPCNLCYKLIVNAGISEVIYGEEYYKKQLQKLIDLGVKVRKYGDH